MKTIVITEFMLRDLHLSGVKLLLYALINSFSEFGQGYFVKDSVACDFLQCSRSQYYLAKNELIKSGFVVSFKNKLFTVCSLRPSEIDDVEFKELVRIAKINIYDEL